MIFPHCLIRQSLLGLGYFAAAGVAVSLTRYEGGVAFLWIATALLIAELAARPRPQWVASIIPCAIGSTLATGMFGLGWAAALPFMAINMTEAMLAAWLFRAHHHPLRPLGSLSWMMHFIVAIGLVAPLVCAVLAAILLWTLGQPPGLAFVTYFTGHALGNVTFTPLAMLFLGGNLARTIKVARRRDVAETALLLAVVIATCGVVFLQSTLPLLFVPILPTILVTFRLGRGGAAVAVVLIAIIGGAMTMTGLGPIHLVAATVGGQLHFFQLYLAATVLTVLPVAAELENRARLHRNLRISEERYRLLAEHSTDILLHLEPNGRIRYVSPSLRQISGHEPASLIGLYPRVLIAPEHLERVTADHFRTIHKRGETHRYEFLALMADGATRWFETHARAMIDQDGEIEGMIQLVRDISVRKAAEQRFVADALTDQLTGLPNRRGLHIEIERRPAACAAHRTDCIAVLDIDHFKVVNDSFGHAAGDNILRGFGKVALRMVRECDLVARVGGEEFAILFPDTKVELAMIICNRLRLEMAQTDFQVGSSTVRVTVSGGVGVIGPEGIAHAIDEADGALYRAKRNGRDQFAQAA